MRKVRVDVLLVERGLAESCAQAQRLVMAGQVRVDGQVILKPSTTVSADAQIEIERGPRFVSRGGEKLEAALQTFGIEVAGRICADVGASTGGFTDCLLQHGAARVYAIDVGKGILHWKLRQDPRVVVMEDTNARYVERLPEPVSLVTIDASFISLKVLLPVVKRWLLPAPTPYPSPNSGGGATTSPPLRVAERGAGGEVGVAERGIGGEGVIALIKPQFEARRRTAARGAGVIRDPEVHRQVVLDISNCAQNEGYGVRGLMRSPLLGPKGNVEFLAWLEYPTRLRSGVRLTFQIAEHGLGECIEVPQVSFEDAKDGRVV